MEKSPSVDFSGGAFAITPATLGTECIVASGIWRHYPAGLFGLSRGPVGLIDVSVSLREGELVCLAGRSGQGKSTLLRILALEDEPSAGTLTVLGRDVTSLTRSERDDLKSEAIHYVPQRHMGLLPRTALDAVAYWLIRFDGLSPDAAERQARAALESVGLPQKKFNERLDHGFSGGEAARVALAVAFARRRPICLADEVFAGLDLESAVPLVGLFRELCRRGAAVAIIVHQPELQPYFDRVIRIADKRIAADEWNPKPMIPLYRPMVDLAPANAADLITVECGNCGRVVEPSDMYCRYCLIPLHGTEACPCGKTQLPVGAGFCTRWFCGRAISGS